MDFDDLTQRLLVAFLRNSTDLIQIQNGGHLARHVSHSASGHQPQHLLANPVHYPGQWLSPTPIVSPLPKPERLQSEPAQLNHDSESDGILFDIFLHNSDSSSQVNDSWQDSAGDSDSTVSRLYLLDFVIGIVLAVVTLATVIGNALVIAAILRERHLRSVGNYLVFSLAVADLMVACLVMPLGALYVVTGEWTLGAAFCDLWTVADVLCCTSSILHLLAIAIDRYWAVTNVDYIHQRRNGSRIGMMIFLIWGASIIISLAPIFGWRDPDFPVRIAQRQCLISQNVTYQIFATCASFYVPLLLILLLYWRIYQVARKRIRRKPGNKVVTLVAMQSASNASNATVENKVIKGMASGVSKTSRKLAKYSAAKYLQKQGARMHSDMMSLDTEHCLHASADSIASPGSPNGCTNGKHNKPGGGDATVGSPISANHLKKLSITSMARTTTTSLATTNPSDLSTCSSFGPPPPIASSQSTRFLPCSKAENSVAGYSFIAEEGSSSSSNAPPLALLRCLENEPEPDLNEHSPLSLSPGFAHRTNRAALPAQANSACSCDLKHLDLQYRILGKPPKRYSLAQAHSRRCSNGVSVLPPPRTKSLSVCTNDANQSALCAQMGALADRYRAQSNDSIAKNEAVGHCAEICDERETTIAADSDNRVNNNAGGGRGGTTDCLVDCQRLASDSNLIAIDTNYCRNSENGHSGASMNSAIAVHNDFAGSHNAMLTSDHTSAFGDKSREVAHCNHSANGGISQHHSSPVHPRPALPAADSVQPTAGLTSSNKLILANDRNVVPTTVTLKEDSNSSSGSNSHQPQHNNHKKQKKQKKRPLKQSSQHSNPSPSPHQSRLYQKESIESKRERKAAKTLAIITGVFVICWLPFFVNAIIYPLSKTYQEFVPSFLTDIFLWAGYLNSCVNPIIYTIFSPDFRTAFKKMLLGKKTVRSPKGWSNNKGMSRV